MKNAIFLISLCSIFFLNNLKAQQEKIITNDSLLQLFKSKNPFEVLNEISVNKYNIDYKLVYKDIRLKPYLMKWLNSDEYFNYSMEVERISYINDIERIRSKVAERLKKQNRISGIDSIMKSKELYKQYRDSVMKLFIALEIKEKEKTHLSNSVPDQAIKVHSILAYPEAYAIIKQWWESTGKGTEKGNAYFIPLVRLGDPEARELYDDKIKQFVKSNGKSADAGEVYSELMMLKNSYSTAKMLEILKVDKSYGKNLGEPFNCKVISSLVEDLFYNSIAIDPALKRNATCKEYMKYLSQIKAASQKLIEKYKLEEQYWARNMPFNAKN